ncbi:MAG: exo-alpha-sialidase [Verrucomicrobia bacterium]|nr:exo-alpha-sialidase [Verrucomicrobiota bacterium]
MSRLAFLSFLFVASLLLGAPAPILHDPGQGPGRNELFSLAVAPWTQEHQRHDHAQIFPLSHGRLLLAWCEYYVRGPARIFRTPYSPEGNTDQVPCQITGKVSKDGGRTWSGRITLQENIGADNVKQPNLVRCANGDIMMFFTRWDFKAQQRSIHYKRSSDECETWSEVKQLTPPGGAYVLDNGRIFIHSSGRIILPTFWTPEIWTKIENYEAFCFYSDDSGLTWQRSRNRMSMPQRGAMEPTVVERKDGSLLVYLRSGVGYLFEAESRDRGETWTEPRPTKITSPQAEPCLRRIPKTGDLLLMWCNAVPYAMTPGGAETYHRPRNPLSCAISRDDGKTWENVKNIENRKGHDSAYPNVHFNGDEALITYYHTSDSTTGDCELMLKIYPVDWFYAPAVTR